MTFASTPQIRELAWEKPEEEKLVEPGEGDEEVDESEGEKEEGGRGGAEHRRTNKANSITLTYVVGVWGKEGGRAGELVDVGRRRGKEGGRAME